MDEEEKDNNEKLELGEQEEQGGDADPFQSQPVKLMFAFLELVNSQPFIYERIINTGNVAMEIFKALNIKITPELIIASYGANIGFIAIPHSIILKQTHLTEKEYGIIKQHPYISADKAERIYFNSLEDTSYMNKLSEPELNAIFEEKNNKFEYIKEIILNHHELPLGKGYYQKSSSISKESYIVGIADRFAGAVNGFSSLYKAVMPAARAADEVVGHLLNNTQLFTNAGIKDENDKPIFDAELYIIKNLLENW